MDHTRRMPALAIGGSIIAAAALAAGTAAQDAPTYRVTIANLAPGQPLTPPVVVLHQAQTSIVEAGAPASEGITQLAENGDAQVLIEALGEDADVAAVAVAAHPVVSGGVPGAAELPSVATLDISGHADRISIASMLICTNDGFSIVHDGSLPAEVGDRLVFFSHAYDAGTEMNTEAFADLVPPCQGLVGVTGDADGTGMSNPELAENGVVTPHAGIAGGADLGEAHTVAQAPAVIVVERTA